jgi:hypothetical protein
MSKSAYVLLALLVVAIIALPILHMVGWIDLSFIGVGFMATLLWASDSILNGALFVAGVFAGGALCYYILKKYIIGTQIPTTVGAYVPQGQVLSQPEKQKEETVVSQ